MAITAEIWLQICRGDTNAYATAYRQLYKQLFNYGRKFSEDVSLVQDVVQETLLTVWYRRATLVNIHHPTTYFYTIFRRMLFQKLQKVTTPLVGEHGNLEPDFSVEQVIINREADAALQQRLQKALAALTARQREAIYLRFYENLSYEEVAEVLGISTKATYKIMARALGQLKERFGSLSMAFFLLKIFFKFFSQHVG